MDTRTLKQHVKSSLNAYTGQGLNGYSYLTSDPDDNVYTSVSVGHFDKQEFTFVDLIVRIVGDFVVIIEDRNSHPVYEALLDAGIPREQIILAYAGEPVPEGV
jgi:hypothetical protein